MIVPFYKGKRDPLPVWRHPPDICLSWWIVPRSAGTGRATPYLCYPKARWPLTARDEDEISSTEDEVVLSNEQIVLSTVPKDDAGMVVLRTTPVDNTDVVDVVILATTGIDRPTR